MSVDISVDTGISDKPARLPMPSRIVSRCMLITFLFLFIHPSYAQPFLWQASGKHTFYLFGTIHLPDPRLASITRDVLAKVKESTAFYGELDLSEQNLLQIRQSMWLPGDETIYDRVPADIQLKVGEYLVSVNPEINLDFFSNQKVWVLAVTLTLLQQQLRYPQLYPMDVTLFNEAISLGKRVGGLETVEDQTSAFDALSNDQQVQLLEDTVDYLIEQDDEFISDSVQEYIDGDLDGLMEHLVAYMQNDDLYDDLLSRLIHQRNVQMAESITTLVSQNPDDHFFFAVGAGHFWGYGSIIELLEEQGYTIESVE